jgi:aminoglycoside 2'-N-acetyltransferase I
VPTDTFHITVLPAAALSAELRQQISALCTAAYEEEMEPVLASLPAPTHVLGWIGDELVSHAAWVTRWLQPAEMAPLRTAYVEAVATAATWRGRGFAAQVMQRLAAEIQDFQLGALSPFSVDYYARLGWQLWRGPLAVRSAAGLVPTPDEEVMILRLPQTPPLDLTAALSVEWRAGEVW